MFTGIVEEIGEVTTLNPSSSDGGTTLTITLPPSSSLLSDCHLGDSISINGVCLTVTTFSLSSPSSPPSFTVGIAPETLRLTNLGSLSPSSRVNLERAVRADTRMGGHFVQGHIDTTATILSKTPDGNALTFRFSPTSKDVLRYIVYKGFIALDGASLTVTKVNDEEGWWEVMLIAYTQEKVVTAGKEVGETVNVEVDMTAKYVEKGIQGYLAGMMEGGQFPWLRNMVERVVAQGFS
ncbi:putative riboflavin synthase alpha chain [Triangularia verruculosa]|uniref:Riboflavin synthase n=1 Tax=Triangularia verruculosa TaxID=2587418 RepID=A0AAN7AZE3_9PEZI|nr:putative riboflavin synthase alpha chain [Triangularia verruculosa]